MSPPSISLNEWIRVEWALGSPTGNHWSISELECSRPVCLSSPYCLRHLKRLLRTEIVPLEEFQKCGKLKAAEITSAIQATVFYGFMGPGAHLAGHGPDIL